MKVYKNYSAWGITGALVLVTIFILSWTGNPQQSGAIANQHEDTIPAKKRTKVTRQPGDRDLDYELRQLDNAREDLKDIDWDDISEKVNSSFKNIDMAKISLDVQKSMEKVDFDKFQRDVEQSLKAVDFDKIQKQLEASFDESGLVTINKEKLKDIMDKAKWEVKEELNKDDWKKELEKVKKIDMKEVEKEMEKAGKEMEKARGEWDMEKFNLKDKLANAGEEIEKARSDLKGYQEMIYAMESEGLLSTKNDYRIEYKKDGDLLINDKKQSQEITDKYKKYFNNLKKGKITIEKEDGEMQINHSNSNVHID